MSREAVCQEERQGTQKAWLQSRVRTGVVSTQMGQGSCGVVEAVCFCVVWTGILGGLDGGVSGTSSAAEGVVAALFCCFLCCSRSLNLDAAFERNSGCPPTTICPPPALVVLNTSTCRLQATNTQPLGYLATNPSLLSPSSIAISSHIGQDSANKDAGTVHSISGIKDIREAVSSVCASSKPGLVVSGFAVLVASEAKTRILAFPVWLDVRSEMLIILKVGGSWLFEESMFCSFRFLKRHR